ncbi:hypothetical protein CSC26_7329 (plasmid) [Pseudomonas aeruginosa]|jgi:hypothetical protein|nr:hypothetical protein CSC26_7329 [Pseudomonas aeruginosa]
MEVFAIPEGLADRPCLLDEAISKVFIHENSKGALKPRA